MARNIDKFDVVNSTIVKIRNQVEDTQDKFIFKTLIDYAAYNYNIVVEKKELIRAIQLIRMYKEHGFLIDEKWETATQNCYELNKAYECGLHDGIKKEHDRIFGILNNFNKEDSNE